ncbi:hypothetical protein K439DRAFT_618242 [Ramaria rubella]|nr:hypothetical protein K439DRAFT_618242 [Ramaria rubella]
MPKKKPIPEPEPTYEVEFIRKARVTEDAAWEYYIKWGNYGEEDNSWEPEENLTGCRRMLKSFWEQIGPKIKGSARALGTGYETEPSAQWIEETPEQERKTYLKSAEKKKAKLRAREEKSSPPHKEKPIKDYRIRATAGQPEAPEDTYSDPDDIPLSLKVAASGGDQKASAVPPDGKNINAARSNSQNERPGRDQQGLGSSSNGEKSSLKRKHEGEQSTSYQASAEPSSKRFKGDAASTAASSALEGSISGLPEVDKRDSTRSSSPAGSLFEEFDSDTPLISKAPVSTQADSSRSTPNEQPPNKPIAPPSISAGVSKSNKPLPAHLQRKLNPRVKQISLPSVGLQGISTKARILALGPGSGIRATDPATQTNIPHPSSSVVLDTQGTSPSPIVEIDGEKWLQENITTEGFASSSALPSTSNAQNLHFSKRWRWSGQLFIGDNHSQSEDAFAELVGGIVLTDNTPMDPTLRYMYSLASLPISLADYKISQFASMNGVTSNDETFFDDLVTYMTKYELYSQSPICLNDEKVATMFVFPASLALLWDLLDIPLKLRHISGLLVAIGFQIFTPHKGKLGRFMESYCPDWKTHATLDAPLDANGSHDYNRALLALKFPDTVFRRIAQKECALFTTPADQEFPGPDTLALKTVLRNAPGCKIVPHLTGSARFIFIHVSAWNILHKLPGLVDRRLRRPDVQFYTYGFDATVDQKYWGMHEVFPIGGVVAFTPRAIAEDPQGVEKLIGKLDEHPLWTCYILPSVVATVVDVINSDKGPDSRLKSVVDALCSVLIPIEKGQIALTWQPPSCRSWSQREGHHTTNDLDPDRVNWMLEQGKLSELKGHELILECRKRLKRSEDHSEKDVESSVIKDMLVMQSELRHEYRRFVIITDTTGSSNTSKEVAANTSASKADIKDGFEFTHVNEFDFRDDYTFLNQ